MVAAMTRPDAPERAEQLLSGMLTQICCIIPIQSFDSRWSLGARLGLFGFWAAVMASGWVLSKLGSG